VTSKRALALVVVAVGASTLAAAAIGDEADQTRRAVPMTDAPTSPVARVPVEASERLSAFARGRRASDALPAAVRNTIAGQPQFGENPHLSRAVVTARGRTQYLVPGDGTLGFYDASGGGATADMRTAVDGQFAMTEMCSGGPGLVVTGLLPADARNAAVVLRSGERVPLSTSEGVYDAAFDPQSAAELPDHVEFTVAGGRRITPLPGMTDDVLTVRCGPPGS
jgi:hypothetical protein